MAAHDTPHPNQVMAVPAPAGNSVRPTDGEEPELTDIGDGDFFKGQAVWVIGRAGAQRAASYVGEGEQSAWFGGPPQVIVVYLDAKVGEAVDVDRVVPRTTEEA
jgi:hypothetical protein